MINMIEKNIAIKPISEILNFDFFIPKYQRGYRWTEQQVEDLLNDITDFQLNEINNTEKSWYCLQPLVVKKKGNAFEVIDGQQRLTTIYLIGHYINEMWRGKDKDPEINLYYETRPDSPKFLKELVVNKGGEIDIEKENIDFFHISIAYKTIHTWVKENKNKDFKKDTFIGKFLNDTKVIWYETTEKDTISMFTRINIGKIPLTDAELIKAKFLNSSNFEKKETVELKQLEIANEWDNIEYSLQNKEFWYFLNENELDTRIEFILDLISDKPKDAKKHFTFIHFNEKFKNYTEQEITDNWQLIRNYFLTFQEWFNDRELYHKIGFLITNGVKINELYNLSQTKTKIEFKQELHKKISELIPDDFEDLTYKDKKTRIVLLMFNIQTMLENELESSRFPFDRYKNEKWDIEHIHSVQEEMPSSEKHQKDWLTNANLFIDHEKNTNLANEITSFIKNSNDKNFDTLYLKILDYFSENQKHDNINDISNLCLLDYKTNRGYGNDVFPVKRQKIIEKDKNGTFIPIGTKNVFLKYYSSKVFQMTFWGEQERLDYINQLNKTLKPYLKTN